MASVDAAKEAAADPISRGIWLWTVGAIGVLAIIHRAFR